MDRATHDRGGGAARTVGYLRISGLVALVLLVGSAVGGASTSTTTNYSGYAYAAGVFGVRILDGTASAADRTVAGSGPFAGSSPQSGNSSLVSFDSGGLPGSPLLPLRVQSGAATSRVTQGDGSSSSSARLATIAVTSASDGSPLVYAEGVTAEATATCSGTASADSRVARLTVGGRAVNLEARGASSIAVGDIATVTLNRTSVEDGDAQRASVDAVVVSFPSDGSLADVITGTVVLGHAESSCSADAPDSTTDANSADKGGRRR